VTARPFIYREADGFYHATLHEWDEISRTAGVTLIEDLNAESSIE
jgi:hypothetical protein